MARNEEKISKKYIQRKVGMIFVTVGTTPFDSLIKAVNESGFQGEVIIQKAEGKYIPSNYEYFDFTSEIDRYYSKADLVVTHGGAGTIFKLLEKGKKIIAVANDDRSDHHQSDILERLSRDGYLIWCRDLANISKCLEEAKNITPTKYLVSDCLIGADIIEKYS